MKSIKFLESISTFDVDGIEVVSINDAITACKLQELETLENCKLTIGWEDTNNARIEELTKQLKNLL